MIPFAFLNPWALLGFTALPVLWFILRFMPPVPKKIFLPTVRFLKDLENRDTTPEKAPWWLILLRLSLLVCLIFAFANPVLHPQKIIPSTTPLRIVFDNGWASAQSWTLETERAEQLLHDAAATNRPVQIQFTATRVASLNFSRADEIISLLHSAAPVSWQGDLTKLDFKDKADTVWVSSGIADPGFTKTATDFASSGRLTVYLPSMSQRAGIIHGPSESENSLLRIETPAGAGSRTVSAQAFDTKGKLINQFSHAISGQPGGEDILDEASLFDDKAIYQWKVPNFAGAGGAYFKDLTNTNRLIGMVTQSKNISSDFTSASFYLTKAVEPFAKVATGSIDDLIEKNCGIIVLADIATFAPDTLVKLEKWTKEGGILLRFGGKSMSEADNVLIPVPLKTGLRSLSGDMAWTTPLKFSAFPDKSPFKGEAVPDISVERQLLAEPSADLQSHIWAQLSDGTPVITAKENGRGLMILVHTTATPEWSDFVLSGFYVNFLKQIVGMSAMPDKTATPATIFQPLLVLNGWGQLEKPSDTVKALTKADLQSALPSVDHPPGIYGDSQKKIPFNLGDSIKTLDLIDQLPDGASSENIAVDQKETKLTTLFFVLAFALFILDWLLLLLSNHFNRSVIAVLFLAMFLFFCLRARGDGYRPCSFYPSCLHQNL